MNESLRNKWNQRYESATHDTLTTTAVLADNCHLLPKQGRALDLACGLGANALLLARHGLEVDAWDISDVAIEWLQQEAEQQCLPVHAKCCDVTAEPLLPQSYNIVIVSRFLERELCPAIIQSLKPGGLLLYQTWTVEKVNQSGLINPHFLLQPNELLQLFAQLRIVAYREEGGIGDLSKGQRNEALLVAQRLF